MFNAKIFRDLIVFCLIAASAYFFFFHQLGRFSLRMWDESRNAINALEMVENGQPLVTTYRGQADHWNTKPPLLIWFMALLISMFEANEYFIRLPSAIAATLVLYSLYLFSVKKLQSFWVGLLAIAILLTAYGFADLHMARTGDYDALLTLFTFLGSVFTFLYLNYWRSQDLYLAATFWYLAVMTKGVAGLLLFPGIIIYLFATRKFKLLITQKRFWLTLFIVIGLIATYYLAHEFQSPGYLKAVWEEEFFYRTTQNNEAGVSPLLYYWQWAVSMRFQHFTPIIPLTLLAWVFYPKKSLKRSWILYSFILTVAYYLIISLTQTKQLWYDAQLYPLVSMLLAFLFVGFIRLLPLPIKLIPIFILSFYLQRYLRTNLAYIDRPDTEPDNPCYRYGNLFMSRSFKDTGYIPVYEDYTHCMPFTFYTLRDGLKDKLIDRLSPGDTALVCDDTTANSLKRLYNLNSIESLTPNCHLYQIQAVKP